MGIPVQVTFDCSNPDALADFWADVLCYQKQPPPEGYADWDAWLREHGIPEEQWNDASAVVDPEGKGPRLYFQRVPEGKTGKNRVHLDVNIGGPSGTSGEERRPRVDAEAERLVGLGATKVLAGEQYGEYWIVMQDPEGNEFCLQ